MSQDTAATTELSPVSTPSEAHEVTEDLSKMIERHLPRVNCSEHIVLVVDVAVEEEKTLYKLGDGSQFSPFYMIKRCLSLFLHNKHAIDSRHKFALVLLHESPIWLHDFTNNPKDIIDQLEQIEESPPSARLDLTPLFDLLQSQITLPECSNPAIAPPSHVVRTILVYGRSLCLPQFLSGKASFTALTECQHFFLDIFYIHEPPSDDNKCEGIYNLLCNLDEGSWGYIVEVARNATRLHDLTASLLAHPLQRPAQKHAFYSLVKPETQG